MSFDCSDTADPLAGFEALAAGFGVSPKTTAFHDAYSARALADTSGSLNFRTCFIGVRGIIYKKG